MGFAPERIICIHIVSYEGLPHSKLGPQSLKHGALAQDGGVSILGLGRVELFNIRSQYPTPHDTRSKAFMRLTFTLITDRKFGRHHIRLRFPQKKKIESRILEKVHNR